MIFSYHEMDGRVAASAIGDMMGDRGTDAIKVRFESLNTLDAGVATVRRADLGRLKIPSRGYFSCPGFGPR